MAEPLGNQMAQAAVEQEATGQPITEEELMSLGADGAPQEESPEGEGLSEEEPTPEEQEAFTKVELAAKAIIYEKEIFNNIVKMLQAGVDNPAKALADAAIMVFSIVDEKSGGTIPEAVILRGGEVTLDLIIKLAEDTGVMEVSEDLANKALQEMMVVAAETYGLPDEGGMEEIQGMDQAEVQKIVAEQDRVARG